MGCTSPAEPSKRSLLKPNIRFEITLDECIAFSSASGLFMAHDKSTDKKYLIRYCPLKGRNIKILQHKMDRITKFQDSLPAFVPYAFMCQTHQHIYFVMENWNCGNVVEGIIKHSFNMTESGLCHAFRGVFLTLQKMHQTGFVHGQISPRKLLLKDNQCYLYDVATGTESIGDFLSENLCYLAPEVLNGELPSAESDVWAMGAILYYLITGHTVYATSPVVEYMRLALSTEPFFRDPVWAALSTQLLELVQQMLEKDKKKRITMKDIVKSDWLTKVGPTKHESLIDYAYFFEKEMDLQKQLTTAISLLANERSKKGLNDLRQELSALDYTKSGVVGLQLIMSKVLDANHEFLKNKTDQQVNYTIILSTAITLNQLISEERLSTMFYKLTGNEKYLDDKGIRELMRRFEHSMILDDANKYKEMIKARQEEKREEVNLTYEEFVKLFDEWGYNLSESHIYND